MSEDSNSISGQVRGFQPRVRLLTQRLGWVVLALLLALVSYLYYFGGYRNLLVDESASFATELTMRILDANRDAKLLVIGNSTVAEGFRASTYNKATAPRISLNLGIGSAHFYAFEKVFALALEHGLAPQAVLLVLTPESLSFRPGYDMLLNDLTIMKTELSADDYPRLWAHTSSAFDYAGHASYVAVRPALYSTDMRDLLTQPIARFRKIRITYGWLKTAGNNPEALETDNKFAVCDAGPLRELEQSIARERTVEGSARLADLERVWAGYSVRAHQSLGIEEFQKARLTRLLRFMADHAENVYVVDAPYYDPDFDAYPANYRAEFSRAVREVVGSVKGATMLSEFQPDCSMFFDTVHLNHAGGDKFTGFLRDQISQASR